MIVGKRAAELREYIEVRRDEMLGLIEQLVNIESPTENPEGTTRVVDCLSQQLQTIGFHVKRISSDRFGAHLVADGGGRQGPRVFAVGHVDTVYPAGSHWPFSRDGDRAYGPGVIDMKSGCVSLIYALKALAETGGIPLPVRVYFNTDEEPGSPESRCNMPELLRDCEYALVLEPAEPSGDGVGERKGVGIFHVVVTGRAAHAGQEPEKGASANQELCGLILEAESLAAPDKGTTVNAGRMEGGTAAYVIPDRAICEIDVRVPDAAEQRRIEEGLAKICATQRVAGTVTTLSGGFHRPPLTRPIGADELLAAWSRAGAALQQKIVFVRSGAASDGNTIAANGVPVLDGLGPIGGRAHSRDEYLEVPSLCERASLLAQGIDELAAASGRG